MTNSYRKEYPLAGFPGFGGGAGALYYKSSADSTKYVDDVFSTYVYTGTGSVNSISNGIKLGNTNAGNSVGLNGSNDYLTISSSSDFAFGTGDFTWEGWFHINDGGSYLINFGADVGNLTYYTYGAATRRLKYYNDSAGSQEVTDTVLSLATWYHIAAARSSGTTKVFLDGTEKLSFTDNKNYGAEVCYLGATSIGGSLLTGNISNVRIVKGQALYTSSFTPSTQALTTTSQGATESNVKLLCCNNSSVTGSTVTPATITAYGFPLAQGFGPFTATDGKGGMVWIKDRDAVNEAVIFDTVRGVTKYILPSHNNVEATQSSNSLTSFNSNGFTIGDWSNVNTSSRSIASWSFAKQKGFFDVVSFTGNGSVRTISHSLGCIPGMIMIKNLSTANSWFTYHRDLGPSAYVMLNHTNTENTGVSWFMNDTSPTATEFTLGTGGNVNESGDEFIAYVFAGGASTAATAPSVDFDGNDHLTLASSADLAPESGDFTWEAWIKPDDWQGTWSNVFGNETSDSLWIGHNNSSQFAVRSFNGSTYITHTPPELGQWTHVAVTRSGSTLRLFYNGTAVGTATNSTNFPAGITHIGHLAGSYYDGKISNLRFVKGTAVYTSSFRPPTGPLTNITNTKLLCCNNSSVTGSTVTPGTITANGDPTASTDSPFDDSSGFKFGEDGDQNIIKTGRYEGNNADDGTEVFLGWEPSLLIIKSVDTTDNWCMFDNLRGITAPNEYDPALFPNSSEAEHDAGTYLEARPTGFKLTTTSDRVNNNSTYVYIAIRRPDGYVGKPPSLGKDVFDIDTWVSDSADPAMMSNFPVDFSLDREPTVSSGWESNMNARGRLIQNKFLIVNGTDAISTGTWGQFDYNNGWFNRQGYTGYSDWTSWMWKRHKGMDVVNYTGNGVVGHQIPHSLSQSPEMIWVKNMDRSDWWAVGHKGLNGGTNPWNYQLKLNESGEDAASAIWNYSEPTSTHFAVGGANTVNYDGENLIAFLFASSNDADGNPISKVGYYAGSGSTQTITTGFQPRFLIVKVIDNTLPWYVLDTTRGWAAGNDPYLQLNDQAAEVNNFDFGAPTTTGFTMVGGAAANNESGLNYIYYAHA